VPVVATAASAELISTRRLEVKVNWQGLERHRIDLKLPLLVIRGSRGVLACGCLNVETLNKTGEVGAIVTGVKTFADMLTAKVVSTSTAAAQAGIKLR
jgi:uncharacterized protein YunC (DUF1805 family)